MASTSASPRRVAVIGAGPAGLSAVDQLLSLSTSCSPQFSVTLFDRRSTHGGVWAYDASPGPCIIRYDATGRAYPLWSNSRKDGSDHGRFRPPGVMYDGLRTNLPCDIMAYRSQPYPDSTALFPDRGTVESYIERFAHDVLSKGEVDVRMGTAVSDVRRISHDPEEAKRNAGWGSTWSITSVDLTTEKVKEEVYDHVVLASGRCNTPSIPRVAGLHRFTGKILHSAWYRSPLPFEDQTILVVGNSSSGSDIARELSGYILRTLPEGESATSSFIQRREQEGQGKVLHSYEHIDQPPPLDYDPREEDSPSWAKRISVVPRIDRVEGQRVFFQGGESRLVDTIIFATGYSYDFPYLPQTLPPFDTHPLIPAPASPYAASRSDTDLEGIEEIYEPSHRTAPYLTNLDDWSLFYAADASVCVLGAPIRIVPMPMTHVQSRIVAAAWAGSLSPDEASTALPRLDAQISSTHPEKWTSRAHGKTQQEANKTADLGYPSDTAYQNALLNLLPDHLRTKGKDESTTVPSPPNDAQKHDSQISPTHQPVSATDEGWSRMPDFRNQRRQDTKRLRRLLLGY